MTYRPEEAERCGPLGGDALAIPILQHACRTPMHWLGNHRRIRVPEEWQPPLRTDGVSAQVFLESASDLYGLFNQIEQRFSLEASMNRALTALNVQKKELENQIAGLQAKLSRVQAAIAALTAGDLFDQPGGLTGRTNRPAGTLKQMAFTVLSEADKAMTANQILQSISDKFGQKIQRTSMSPQLSRLGDAGVLLRIDNLWSINPATKTRSEIFYLLKPDGDLI